MSDGPSMECPLCKRPAHCSYHQGLTQTIKCDGCGFNHTHGMLGSPPEQQRDISLLTNSMPTVSQKDITDWCGYDVKKAAIAARSTVSLEPWLETKHAINAALHNKGDAFTRKDEEVADINLSVSAPSPISPCEISVVDESKLYSEITEVAWRYCDNQPVSMVDAIMDIIRPYLRTTEPVKQLACGDWEEDYQQENGNYQCRCAVCGNAFFGHKRRAICKTCSTPKPVSGHLEVLKNVLRFADGRCWPEVQVAIDANREILNHVD